MYLVHAQSPFRKKTTPGLFFFFWEPLATIYQKRVSSMNRKRDTNKSFISLRARHVHPREFFHFIPYIPTLPPYDMEPNESEMRLYNNNQCGMDCMCACALTLAFAPCRAVFSPASFARTSLHRLVRLPNLRS